MQGVQTVGHRRVDDRHTAVRADDGGEGELVDVVQLARTERFAGRDDLVAARQDRDARPGEDVDLGQSHGGERADAAGGQHVARCEERLTRGDVGAAPPDVLARVDRRQDADLAGAAFLGFLDHHHRIGAFRQRGAGRDLDAGAARHALARDLTGEDAFDAGERLRLERAGAEGVGGDHRVAVHRGAIERRDIDGRDRGPRDHAAVRLADGDPLGALDRDGGLDDERAGLVERDGFADRADGSHGCV